MKEKIYFYDQKKCDYVDKVEFFAHMDQLRRDQLKKWADILQRDKKLNGPLVEYMGEKTWRIKIRNNDNYYESHLLRVGENEGEAKLPSFLDDYRGVEDLKKLRISFWRYTDPALHRWNTYEQCWYNTEEWWTIEEFFKKKKLSPEEVEEVYNLLDESIKGRGSAQIVSFSDISYEIDTILKSGRELKYKIKIG